VATATNDTALLEKTAKEWGAGMGKDLNPNDLLCDGCKSTRMSPVCAGCPFIDCEHAQGLENCGYCHEYPCELVNRLLAEAPHKAYLDELSRKRPS
jgi:hypothetical protein